MATIDDYRAQRVVAVAKSFLGAPYARGGTTIDGIDCSGLVMQAYGIGAGIKLPHKARDIRRTAGREVSLADLRIADIVYVNTGGAVDHVGIYDGQGNVIHSTSVYAGTVIQPISEWREKGWLDGARRVLGVSSAVYVPGPISPTFISNSSPAAAAEESAWPAVIVILGALGLAGSAAYLLHVLAKRR